MTTDRKQQFVRYAFYKIDSAWRRLDTSEKTQSKKEFVDVLEKFQTDLIVRTYSLVGTRADAEIMIWSVSQTLEQQQLLASALLSTTLGSYLEIKYSYFAMTRRSVYLDSHEEKDKQDRTILRPMNRPYLFVYPFVKTHEWYQLPMQERQRMMEEHFEVGHKYPEVKVHTSYSFGLDDQEFVLGFETDNPGRFLDLVMELRHAEQRPYTQVDTPIFTCLLKTALETVADLG